MKIEITTDSDDHKCECCGMTYAEGGKVHVDGKLIVDLPAIAHCCGGQSFSQDELLVIALHELGHTVDVDGYPFHISCVYA